MVIDDPINGESFLACLRPVLVPTLHPGDVVIVDNRASHKGAAVREAIEAAGASLGFLPAYSPDVNPIENALAKLKALRRTVATRARDALRATLGPAIDRSTTDEGQNHFSAAGHEPE
ncbi:MAG: transposase [Pseudomonadota bacterium]